MFKFSLYIIIILTISSCFNFNMNKPFRDNNKNDTKFIKKDIFIKEIIGLKKNQSDELKIIINENFTNKNILSSYKFFNKNSYILTASIIKYPKNFKIIWKLNDPNINKNRKYVFELKNKNPNNYNISDLSEIAINIANEIEKFLLNELNYKIIKINEIKGINNNKKETFFKNLKKISKNYKIKYLLKSEKTTPKLNLDIIFIFNNNNDKNTEVKINWILKNTNKKVLANLEQNKTINNKLLNDIWPLLTEKIIEMALYDINYLINIENK